MAELSAPLARLSLQFEQRVFVGGRQVFLRVECGGGAARLDDLAGEVVILGHLFAF